MAAKTAKRQRRSEDKVGYGGQIPPRDYEVRDPDGEGKRTVTVKFRHDRLSYLLSHKHIRQDQFDAGRRLQRDYEQSEILVMASSAGGGTAHAATRNTLADNKLMAGRRYGDAIRLLPPDIRRIVDIVLLEDGDHSIERAASVVRIHRKAGLPMLRSGLDILARHYGFA